MRSLIIGASGKIGKIMYGKHFIKTYYKNKFEGGIKFNLLKDNVDIIIKKYNIKNVVLLSAISDPDECLKKKNYSNLLNIIKTKKLIDKLINKKIFFIFFSTEYIFNGSSGNYNENSPINPVNLYGKQKYIIENYIRNKTKNFCILRIAKTYGDDINDTTLISGFLKNLINGKNFFLIATDQKFSPLYVKDLKKIINLFLKKEVKGVFNLGGPEQLSRYDCINIILHLLGKKIKSKIIIKKTLIKNVNTLDKRPLDVSMDIKKIKKVINFKLKKFAAIANIIIEKNNAKYKILKRRH